MNPRSARVLATHHAPVTAGVTRRDLITLRRRGVDLAPQLFAISTPSASPLSDVEAATSDEPQATLNGLPSADIRAGDEFVLDGVVWQVQSVAALSAFSTMRRAEARVKAAAR